jgi:hypothetical protein
MPTNSDEEPPFQETSKGGTAFLVETFFPRTVMQQGLDHRVVFCVAALLLASGSMATAIMRQHEEPDCR